MKIFTVATAMVLGLLTCQIAFSAPVVTGTTISWPDNGWYQVQDEATYTEVCGGGRSCVVEPGSYVVINHSTGERFKGIVVADSASTERVSVTGNVISWPDDGWYQVQDEATYAEVCGGGHSCVVEAGSYVVINHSTGERFRGIAVGSGNSSIEVNGLTISWPDDGWYQVQNPLTYETLCEGGTSCTVESPGSYRVINHTTGERIENVLVDPATSVLSLDESLLRYVRLSQRAGSKVIETFNEQYRSGTLPVESTQCIEEGREWPVTRFFCSLQPDGRYVLDNWDINNVRAIGLGSASSITNFELCRTSIASGDTIDNCKLLKIQASTNGLNMVFASGNDDEFGGIAPGFVLITDRVEDIDNNSFLSIREFTGETHENLCWFRTFYATSDGSEVTYSQFGPSEESCKTQLNNASDLIEDFLAR